MWRAVRHEIDELVTDLEWAQEGWVVSPSVGVGNSALFVSICEL